MNIINTVVGNIGATQEATMECLYGAGSGSVRSGLGGSGSVRSGIGRSGLGGWNKEYRGCR